MHNGRLRAALILVVTSLSVHGASAQAPPALKKVYTNLPKFKLPVTIAPADAPKVREVVLFAKTPATQWTRQEAVPPATPFLLYQTKEDGEYFFKLVTVDLAGKSNPADLNQTVPDLHIIVDTKPPVVTGQFGHVGNGEPSVQCLLDDPHADKLSVRAYVVTETGERPLVPVPDQPNVFKLISADVNYPVKLEGSDWAHNKGTKLMPPFKSPAPTQLAGGLPLPGMLPPAGLPLPPAQTPVVAPPPLQIAAVPPPMQPMTVTPPPVQPPALVPPPPTPTSIPQVATFVPPPTVTSPAVNTTAYRPETPPAQLSQRTPGSRKLINTLRAQIDYRLDSVGPSGVGKVELFLTADNGQSWQPAGEDLDKRSPAEVDLPGEGIYGIRLVITNNHGFGGKHPVRGDAPHIVVESDVNAPSVVFRPIEMVPQQASIDIHWTAQDNKQLAFDPISIYYRSRSDGAWAAIARNVKNDGQYRWAFPRDIGGQFFLKIEAVDQAGNVARAESPAISLDLQVPNVEVVDVVGGRN